MGKGNQSGVAISHNPLVHDGHLVGEYKILVGSRLHYKEQGIPKTINPPSWSYEYFSPLAARPFTLKTLKVEVRGNKRRHKST